MRRVFLAVFALGFSAMVLQLSALRCFYSSFDGNELVFAVVFGCWLLLTGVGGLLGRFTAGRRENPNLFIALQLLLSLMLPATVFLASVSGELFTVRGELVSLPLVLFTSLMVLAPYCLLSGFQIVYSLCMLPQSKDNVGRVYSTEALGGLAGGFLFSFLLVTLLDTFQTACLLFTANLLACLLLSLGSRRMLVLTVFIGLAGLLFISQFDLNAVSNGLHYPGQQVLFQGDSPYGAIVLTNSSGQLNLYENGVPLRSSGLTMDVEEAVHYGMAQHPKPRRVLVISGGFSAVREVLKYGSVEHVDYVELDPLVLDVEGRFMGGVNDSRVTLHAYDGRVYAREEVASGGGYDVVLVSLPDPANAQVGRFYTVEFFRDARRLLGDSGVFSISVSSNQNYQSPESRRLNACVYQTLKAVYASVLVVPGGRNYYLASDGNLTYDIAGRMEKLGVETYFVNKYYLDGMLTPERIKYALDSISGVDTIVNADFKPVSYYYYLEYWARYFRLDMRLIATILLLALFAALHKLRPLHFAVYTAGFSGAALEVILLLAFQALYGVAYRWVGLLASSFMLGLFLGSRHASRRNGELRTVRSLLSFICVYSIALPAVTYTLSILPPGASSTAAKLAFPLLAAILGFLVGFLFPTAASVVQKDGGSGTDAMGVLYFLDMSGAFFGSLISGILLVPLLGVAYASLIVAILNLTSVIRLRR